MREVAGKRLAVALTLLLVAGVAYAVENGDNPGEHRGERGRKHHGEMNPALQNVRKEMQEFHQKQAEARKAFRESIKDDEPSVALDKIIAERNKCFNEKKTFMQGQYDKMIAALKEKMSQKEGSEDQQGDKLAALEKKHAERVASHEEMHGKLIAALTALKEKADLSFSDIKDAMHSVGGEHHRDGHKNADGKCGHDRKRKEGHDRKGPDSVDTLDTV